MLLAKFRLCCVAGSLMALLGATAQAEKTVRVFILAGQSNMQGHGRVEPDPKSDRTAGTLRWFVQQPERKETAKLLVDSSGAWIERDDVQIWYLGRQGNLKAGYGVNEQMIGPELGFGMVVGEALSDPVLLIKLAWGGKSLAKDFRPPSAGGEVGPYYQDVVKLSLEVLRDGSKLFPQFADCQFRLAGFGWHQGWNDRVNQEFNAAYEENMTHFIHDIRKDLGAEKLPFVIAETGMGDDGDTHPRAVSLMKAQAAVAAREEFRGNVAFVSTRAFYRKADVSPSKQGYHWNSNAESYFLIGEAMGQAMLKLLAD